MQTFSSLKAVGAVTTSTCSSDTAITVLLKEIIQKLEKVAKLTFATQESSFNLLQINKSLTWKVNQNAVLQYINF